MDAFFVDTQFGKIMTQKRIVVALGGNAITREFEDGNIAQQFANTRRSLIGITEIIKDGSILALTHGNGPQVGNYLIRVEATRDKVTPIPLGVMVADLCGGMGYMITQSLQNKLIVQNIAREVTTIPAQVIVDKNDPSILNPTKFVGSFYKEEQAKKIQKERNWTMKEDTGRGWRRVVTSPMPISIVEKEIIKDLFDRGVIVVTVGGGGIPVYITEEKTYEGVDAVIDKDLSSAVLAKELEADELHLLTAVEKVALNFGTPRQEYLDSLTVEEAKIYLNECQFPKGSMGPKIYSAINFLESGGKKVIITSVEKHLAALEGRTGTTIHN